MILNLLIYATEKEIVYKCGVNSLGRFAAILTNATCVLISPIVWACTQVHASLDYISILPQTYIIAAICDLPC